MVDWPKLQGVPRTVARDGSMAIYDVGILCHGRLKRRIHLRVTRDGFADVASFMLGTGPSGLARFYPDGSTSFRCYYDDQRALWNQIGPKVRTIWRACCAALQNAQGEA